MVLNQYMDRFKEPVVRAFVMWERHMGWLGCKIQPTSEIIQIWVTTIFFTMTDSIFLLHASSFFFFKSWFSILLHSLIITKEKKQGKGTQNLFFTLAWKSLFLSSFSFCFCFRRHIQRQPRLALNFIVLSQAPYCWDYRPALLCLVNS